MSVAQDKYDEKIKAAFREKDAEIKRLRSALSKYADPNYNGYNGGPEHARAALKPAPFDPVIT